MSGDWLLIAYRGGVYLDANIGDLHVNLIEHFFEIKLTS